MVDEKFLHSEITSKILQAFYTVYNCFHFGYPKSIYENSMLLEMRKLGLDCMRNQKEKIYYDKQIVGEFEADMIINNSVAINIETKETVFKEDEFKVHYFIRASRFEVGLFLNFGKNPYHKRKHFRNDAKEFKI